MNHVIHAAMDRWPTDAELSEIFGKNDKFEEQSLLDLLLSDYLRFFLEREEKKRNDQSKQPPLPPTTEPKKKIDTTWQSL